MANDVTNIITIYGDDSTVERIKELVTNEKGEFDFNRIIPMPERLDIRKSLSGEQGMEYLLGKVDALPLMSEESKPENGKSGMKKNDITEIDLTEEKILGAFWAVAKESGNRFLELGIEYGAYETSITAKIPTRLFIDKLRDNEARSSSPQDRR